MDKGSAPSRLIGLRVLLVEDEVVAAMEIARALSLYGCDVVATAGDIESARAAAKEGGFDVALLDINLNGIPSFPVAELLAEKQVPFIVATAYTRLELPSRLQSAPLLRKPFGPRELRDALQDIFD